MLGLLSLVVLVCADSCSNLRTCYSIKNSTCGWCWEGVTTQGQVHYGRSGNASGPTDGKGACADWEYDSRQCHAHVDCPFLPDCGNIIGTYCGWCGDSQRAARGNSSGPYSGSCAEWVWAHSDCPVNTSPEQVHISYGSDPSQMVVTWSTAANGAPEVVYWQVADPSRKITQKGSTSVLGTTDGNADGKQFIHRAVLGSLVPGERYSYFVQVDTRVSETFVFSAMRAGSDISTSFIVYGDMGRHGGGQVLWDVVKDVTHSPPDAIIHIGDFAYDLDSSGGFVGDTFMNRIQPIAAAIPYMTCPGNHETGYLFAHYRKRFSMPGSDANNGFNMWHSWDIGRVHFISYSSEVYFSLVEDIAKQEAWLRADLKAANENRDARPWIIAYGHRQMYCSNTDHDDCATPASKVRAGLEHIFHEGGVDLVFEAHEHSYERMWPVYREEVTQRNYRNPEAMVHVVTGQAGCNEDDGACVNTIGPPLGDWSAFRSSAQGTYAYGHLKVVNSTHLYWDSYLTERDIVEDSMWIVQESHGPREN